MVTHPGTRPTEKGWFAVDTNILRNTSEKVAPDEDTPHGCYESWVYMGFEEEDENSSEHVEVIERVPAAAAVPKPDSPGPVPLDHDQGEG